MAATLPSFGGWEDMANYTATQAAGLAQNQAPTVTAAKLAPVTEAGGVGIGSSAPITAQGVLGDQRQFMDPYLGAVVGTSLSNFDQTANQRLAQMQADAARNGALSGSRFGIAQGQAVADSILGRATLEAQLRSNGWNSALNSALQLGTQNQNSDLQRAIAQGNISAQISMANAANANQAAMNQANLDQQAALASAQMQQQQQQQNLAALGLIGNTSNAVANNVQQANAGDRADLALIADLGAQQRAIELQQANALPSQLQTEGALLGAVPTGAFTGQTVDVTGNSTTEQSGGGLLGGILGAVSLIPGIGDAAKTVGKVF